MEQLKSQFNKLYFEYYAKYSLIFSNDKKYCNLQKSESPDWQSAKLDIGLEVTRAIAKDISLAYDIIAEYFGNGCDESIYKNIKNCSSENSLQISIDDIANIENLKNVYLHKTQKLNKNYTQYAANLLYMFTFRTMDENEVIKCFDIELSKYKKNYDYCFVNCFDRLYICDFVGKSVLETIHLNRKNIRKVKRKAYSKSKLK